MTAYDNWLLPVDDPRDREDTDDDLEEEEFWPDDEEVREPTKSETDRAAREYEAYIHRDRT